MTRNRNRTQPASVLMCVASLFCCVGQVVFLKNSAAVDPPHNAADVAEVVRLASLAQTTLANIETAQLTFRAASTGRVKQSLNAAECEKLMQQFDLVHHPEKLRELILLLALDETQVSDTPWTDVKLYKDAAGLRTSRTAHGKTDEHITDQQFSMRWDASNYHLHVKLISENRYGQFQLNDFLRALPTKDKDDLAGMVIGKTADTFHLTIVGDQIRRRPEITVDKSTGFVVRQRMHQQNKGVVEDEYWLGWRQYPGNVSFPTVAATFRFFDSLTYYQVLILKDARFNEPITEGTFTMSAPAGAYLFHLPTYPSGTVNYDIQDVMSRPQLRRAMRPLEMNSDVQNGIDRVKKLCRLAEGEVVKRLPPFRPTHLALRRMIGDNEAVKPGKHSLLISTDGQEFKRKSQHEGGYFSAAGLLMRLAKLESTQIDGDQELLDTRIPGDIIYRDGAPVESYLSAIENIVEAETDAELTIQFREVERPFCVVSGTYEVDSPLRKRIDMNAGPHDGDFGEIHGSGDFDRFLRELSNYVKMKIVSDVDSPPKKLQWSRRWYDLKSTEPEDRFEFDASAVLDNISTQTGLQFRKERRKSRVLFVERSDE